MWTLYDLLNFANGSSLIKNESSFGKKVKFHQMYEYIKKNREYEYNRDIPQPKYAFAKYAKMSVSLQNLRIKKSRAVTWCQRIPIH